jgi:hypothetical protein
MSTKGITISAIPIVVDVSSPAKTVTVDTVSVSVNLTGYGPLSDSDITDNKRKVIASDTLNLLDNLTTSVSKRLQDDFTLLDFSLVSVSKVLNTAFDISDSTPSFSFSKGLPESYFSVTDSAGTRILLDKGVIDSFTMSDSRLISVNKGILDDTYFGDYHYTLVGKNIESPVSMSDTHSIQWDATRNISETLTLTDTFVRQFDTTRAFNETIQLDDYGGALVQGYAAETYFAEDYAVGQYSEFGLDDGQLYDILWLYDGINKFDTGKGILVSFSTADSLDTIDVNKGLTDSFSFAHIRSADVTKVLSDTITMPDVFSADVSKTLTTDSFLLLDKATTSAGKVIEDSFTTANTQSFVVGKKLETVATFVTESINIQWDANPSLNTTISLLDNLDIQWDSIRDLPTDVATITDTGGCLIQSYNSDNYFAQDYAVGTYSAFS